GHGPMGHRYDHSMPGSSHMRYGAALMAQNPPGVLHTDLAACATYESGPDAAKAITKASTCILAGQDKMTPVKAGRALAAALPNNTTIELPEAGHMVTTEAPFEVNRAITDHLTRTALHLS
ncbi:MAG: alpha/beta hydrolase, partial [Pseudomonadota bacterium]